MGALFVDEIGVCHADLSRSLEDAPSPRVL